MTQVTDYGSGKLSLQRRNEVLAALAIEREITLNRILASNIIREIEQPESNFRKFFRPLLKPFRKMKRDPEPVIVLPDPEPIIEVKKENIFRRMWNRIIKFFKKDKNEDL